MANKSKIDWCDYSWNPITGCKHNCSYCYASRMVKRFSGDIRLNKAKEALYTFDSEKGLYALDKPFITRENRALNYPFGFEPTFHKYRLDWPNKVKNGARVFVGSMSDCFGEWVPDEWIKMVFEACKQYPQHTFMFLTKNPERYTTLLKTYGSCFFPQNALYGASAINKDMLHKAGKVFYEIHDNNYEFGSNIKTFYSVEPLLEDLTTYPSWYYGKGQPFDWCNWVIVGAETGYRKSKVVPKKEWIIDIINQCKQAQVPIFLKENLQGIIGKDYDLKLLQQYPNVKEG